jgi:two-component system, cell cycle response regulator DivK
MNQSDMNSLPVKKKVLVIEDDEKNLRLMEDLLEFNGYIVIKAMDGKQGVDSVRTEKPDLILMDIQMPVMDGMEATKILKGDEETRDIPIIALTSYAMQGDEQRIRETGCDGYMTKPIDVKNFLKEVDKILNE